MRSLVLFNNKGGVGKTTLTFNLAHALGRLGYRVAAMDCDPQCNLSAIFLGEEDLLELWQSEHADTRTVAGCVDLVRRGKGDVREPTMTQVAEADNLWLLPNHLHLSRFEQPLAEEWPKTMSPDNDRALDVTLALEVLANLAGRAVNADILMIDVGPSLGALNRAALLACDAVILPLAPDLFSLKGMENVGPTLREWRTHWQRLHDIVLADVDQHDVVLADEDARRESVSHEFRPIGYIVQQHLARADRPVRGYMQWAKQIPSTYHGVVLGEPRPDPELTVETDPACIATIKHYASLVPIAQRVRKPIFDLKQADGISGGQIQSVYRCRADFTDLAERIAHRLGVTLD
jgi:cellulose biosynthesis protein BcsQ